MIWFTAIHVLQDCWSWLYEVEVVWEVMIGSDEKEAVPGSANMSV